MYRLVITEEVIYGHYREYADICKEMAAHAATKGWATPVYMWPTVGTMNQAITHIDYRDLSEFEREGREIQTDADFMKLVRRQGELTVQGSGHTALFETISDLA